MTDDEDLDDPSGEETLACPECGADTHADAEACPACGYWITEADRAAQWRAGSASGRVVRVGWWLMGAALLLYLLAGLA